MDLAYSKWWNPRLDDTCILIPAFCCKFTIGNTCYYSVTSNLGFTGTFWMHFMYFIIHCKAPQNLLWSVVLIFLLFVLFPISYSFLKPFPYSIRFVFCLSLMPSSISWLLVERRLLLFYVEICYISSCNNYTKLMQQLYSAKRHCVFVHIHFFPEAICLNFHLTSCGN